MVATGVTMGVELPMEEEEEEEEEVCVVVELGVMADVFVEVGEVGEVGTGEGEMVAGLRGWSVVTFSGVCANEPTSRGWREEQR